MKKCESYHTRERYIYDPYITTMKHTIVEGICYGTKERETCDCEGNECYCDFYPAVREKAFKEKEFKQNTTVPALDILKFYLDSSHEKNDVIYIPKFMVEKMIEELENNGGGH